MVLFAFVYTSLGLRRCVRMLIFFGGLYEKATFLFFEGGDCLMVVIRLFYTFVILYF